VALNVEHCRRWRSRWRPCGSITAHVNTWPRWSTGNRERALRGERSGPTSCVGLQRKWPLSLLARPSTLRDIRRKWWSTISVRERRRPSCRFGPFAGSWLPRAGCSMSWRPKQCKTRRSRSGGRRRGSRQIDRRERPRCAEPPVSRPVVPVGRITDFLPAPRKTRPA
jgi:hypothetical protein